MAAPTACARERGPGQLCVGEGLVLVRQSECVCVCGVMRVSGMLRVACGVLRLRSLADVYEGAPAVYAKS